MLLNPNYEGHEANQNKENDSPNVLMIFLFCAKHL